jgi:putative transposase
MEQRRTIVGEVALTAGSERRACQWVGFHRSAIRYRTQRQRDDTALRQRLRELATLHPRWGSPLLIWQLRTQEGWPDNHKRIRRLYRAEGLAVQRRAKRKLIVARVPLPSVTRPNERWALDFVRDTLVSGAAFRALTLVDICTRESLAIEVDVSLGAERVVAVLETLSARRGYPAALVLDNGPEFQSRALHAWAQARGVQLHFIRPGRPVENAFIESFNGRFRDECLSQHWFLTLAEARAVIEHWRVSYNTARSHRALGRLTPAQFAARFHPPTAAEVQALQPTLTTRLSA